MELSEKIISQQRHSAYQPNELDRIDEENIFLRTDASFFLFLLFLLVKGINTAQSTAQTDIDAMGMCLQISLCRRDVNVFGVSKTVPFIDVIRVVHRSIPTIYVV